MIQIWFDSMFSLSISFLDHILILDIYILFFIFQNISADSKSSMFFCNITISNHTNSLEYKSLQVNLNFAWTKTSLLSIQLSISNSNWTQQNIIIEFFHSVDWMSLLIWYANKSISRTRLLDSDRKTYYQIIHVIILDSNEANIFKDHIGLITLSCEHYSPCTHYVKKKHRIHIKMFYAYSIKVFDRERK